MAQMIDHVIRKSIGRRSSTISIKRPVLLLALISKRNTIKHKLFMQKYLKICNKNKYRTKTKEDNELNQDDNMHD